MAFIHCPTCRITSAFAGRITPETGTPCCARCYTITTVATREQVGQMEAEQEAAYRAAVRKAEAEAKAAVRILG